MTNLLKREDLFSLEEYTEQRSNIRKNVMNVKKLREVNLGEHIRLLFENNQTVQYQVQEMLRIEKIFEAAGIQDELDVYNPLIPDGSNLKATMMIEYTDVVERTKALSNLIGIEKNIYFQVGNHQNVYAICNEDLERETDEKTSSVHFMRFEFEQTMIADFCKGINVKIGVSHPNYDCEIILEQRVKDQLNKDFMNGEE